MQVAHRGEGQVGRARRRAPRARSPSGLPLAPRSTHDPRGLRARARSAGARFPIPRRPRVRPSRSRPGHGGPRAPDVPSRSPAGSSPRPSRPAGRRSAPSSGGGRRRAATRPWARTRRRTGEGTAGWPAQTPRRSLRISSSSFAHAWIVCVWGACSPRSPAISTTAPVRQSTSSGLPASRSWSIEVL